MLDIQVKCITLKSFSCFIDGGWILIDPQKLNCKCNNKCPSFCSESSRSAMDFTPIFLFMGQEGHSPDSARIGEYHIWAGGVEESLPKSKGFLKEGGFRLRGCSLCVRRSSFAAQLLQGCQELFQSCQGPGASDKNERSGTSAFCDCCPKTRGERSAASVHSAGEPERVLELDMPLCSAALPSPGEPGTSRWGILGLSLRIFLWQDCPPPHYHR